MVDVITHVDIAAPVDKVTGYAMNQDNAPEWYANIKSVEWHTPKPMTIGSKFAFGAHFLGRKLSYVYEVVRLENDEMVMRTVDGPFLMETTYRFEKISNNLTRMTLRNRGIPSGFSKLVAPFIAWMMRRANNKDLRSIKELIERKNRQ